MADYRRFTTGSAMGPAGTGGVTTWWECLDCGVAVCDTDEHDSFHENLVTIADLEDLRTQKDDDIASLRDEIEGVRRLIDGGFE